MIKIGMNEIDYGLHQTLMSKRKKQIQLLHPPPSDLIPSPERQILRSMTKLIGNRWCGLEAGFRVY